MLHLAGCFLFIFSPVFFGPPPSPFPEYRILLVPIVVDNIFITIFFYLNLFFLIPKVLARFGWPRYLLTVLISVLAFGALKLLTHKVISPGLYLGPISLERVESPAPAAPHIPWDTSLNPFISTFPFMMAWALSTSIKFSIDYTRLDRERKDRENESLKSELSLLRSQISPHFMFNVLNSLTALARKKSDELEPIIIKLSQLMRYMLYDLGVNKVSIETEIEYLQNYIDLQRLRFGSFIDIKFDKAGDNSDFLIEPMLLIPFVENAFKHGTGLIARPQIDVSIHILGERLNFAVRNKYNADTGEVKDNTHGIGLQNVKRRLALLYPGKYELVIEKDDQWFAIKLNLLAA